MKAAGTRQDHVSDYAVIDTRASDEASSGRSTMSCCIWNSSGQVLRMLPQRTVDGGGGGNPVDKRLQDAENAAFLLKASGTDQGSTNRRVLREAKCKRASPSSEIGVVESMLTSHCDCRDT